MTGGPGPQAPAGFGAAPRPILAAAILLSLVAQAAGAQTCVEATVGAGRAYLCINDALARMAKQAHAPLEMNTLGATSPAPAVGTFDRTATAERMGNAFGRSVIAQRPAASVYAVPLVGR